MAAPSKKQHLLESAILAELRQAGYPEPAVERATFEAPFYNPGRPELSIEIRVDDVHVWLYDDTVVFTVGAIQDRFERMSFSGDQSFLDASVAGLRRALIAEQAT